MAPCLPSLQRPSPSTPANRRKRALPTHGPQTLTKRRTHAVPSRRRRQPTPLTSSKLTKSRAPALVAIPALSPLPSSPHRSRSPRQGLFRPAVSAMEAFGRRPRGARTHLSGAGVRNPSLLRSFSITPQLSTLDDQPSLPRPRSVTARVLTGPNFWACRGKFSGTIARTSSLTGAPRRTVNLLRMSLLCTNFLCAIPLASIIDCGTRLALRFSGSPHEVSASMIEPNGDYA